MAYGSFRVIELTVNLILMLRIMELLADRHRALLYLLWFAGVISVFAVFGAWKDYGTGLFFHSNIIPMAGGMCTLLAIGCLMTGALPVKLTVPPAICGTLALVGGTSSGSNVAFALSFIVMLLFGAKAHRSGVRLIAFACLVTLALLATLTSGTHIKQVLFPGKDDANIRSATGRIDVWMAYYEMFEQKPLFGHGFPTGEKEVTGGRWAGSGTTGSTHNMVMSVLVNTGLVGLALYTLWLSATIISLLRAAKMPHSTAYAIPLLGCLLLGIINSQTLPVLGSHWLYPVMILYGTLAHYAIFLDGKSLGLKRVPLQNHRRLQPTPVGFVARARL